MMFHRSRHLTFGSLKIRIVFFRLRACPLAPGVASQVIARASAQIQHGSKQLGSTLGCRAHLHNALTRVLQHLAFSAQVEGEMNRFA